MILKELGGFDSFTRSRAHKRISIFSHRLVMQRSWIWPDLRSQIYKLWDIQIVHGGTLIKTWRAEIDPYPWKTLALAWFQTFLRWGQQTASSDLNWPDPVFFFFLSKCAQWMFGKSHQVWAFYLAAFGNGTRKNLRGGLKDPPPHSPVRNMVKSRSMQNEPEIHMYPKNKHGETL